MSAVYIVVASLHYKKRVENPTKNAVKRLGALLTRKGGAKGAVGARADGLVVQFRNLINQPRFDDELRRLSAVKADEKLLVRWDSILFSEMHFNAIAEPGAQSADTILSAASTSGASSPDCAQNHCRQDGGEGSVLCTTTRAVGTSPHGQRRWVLRRCKPHARYGCWHLRRLHSPCWQQQRGTFSCRCRRRSAHFAGHNIPRASDHGHGNADGDANDDDDADADPDADNSALPLAPPVTPAPVSADRHAATYEL
eukprot:1089812-Pleurochrysis_carterae.AAC.1